MFVDRTVPQISQDWERFGFVREMSAQIGAVIQRAIDAGTFPRGTHPDAVFRMLITAIHGAAVGRLCDRWRRARTRTPSPATRSRRR